jgi:hypothetical protein
MMRDLLFGENEPDYSDPIEGLPRTPFQFAVQDPAQDAFQFPFQFPPQDPGMDESQYAPVDMPENLLQEVDTQDPFAQDENMLGQTNAFDWAEHFNPNASLVENAYDIGRAFAEEQGFELGVFGRLNLRQSLLQNVWNIAREMAMESESDEDVAREGSPADLTGGVAEVAEKNEPLVETLSNLFPGAYTEMDTTADLLLSNIAQLQDETAKINRLWNMWGESTPGIEQEEMPASQFTEAYDWQNASSTLQSNEAMSAGGTLGDQYPSQFELNDRLPREMNLPEPTFGYPDEAPQQTLGEQYTTVEEIGRALEQTPRFEQFNDLRQPDDFVDSLAYVTPETMDAKPGQGLEMNANEVGAFTEANQFAGASAVVAQAQNVSEIGVDINTPEITTGKVVEAIGLDVLPSASELIGALIKLLG